MIAFFALVRVDLSNVNPSLPSLLVCGSMTGASYRKFKLTVKGKKE